MQRLWWEDIERTEGIYYQFRKNSRIETEKAVAKRRKSRKQPEETYMKKFIREGIKSKGYTEDPGDGYAAELGMTYTFQACAGGHVPAVR